MRSALTALSASTLLAALGTSIANVGLPAISQAFGASFQAVQWVVIAYLLAITVLIVGAGRLGDVVGRRRLLLAGIGVFTAGSLLCGVAPTLWLLVAARAVQGTGAAVMMALTMALVSDAVPAARTGSAMGLLGTMSAVGTALGPTLGGVLIAAFGWHALFLANVPLGAAALLFAHRYLPDDLALRAGPRAAPPHGLIETLRNSAIIGGLVMNALVSTVMMATLVVGPFYLTRGLGLPPVIVGMVMSTGPVAAALSGVPAGRLADRIGVFHATLIGLGTMVAGTILLAASRIAGGAAAYVAPLVVLTVGYAVFQAANNTAVMSGAASDRRGAVAGVLGLSRNVGLVAGASVMGAVFAYAAGGDAAVAPAHAVAQGMRASFAVAAVLISVALAVALKQRTVRQVAGGFVA